jgi:hypothetical protein
MNWSIAQLERNTSDGGVTVAHWRVSAEETVGTGDDAVTYSASAYSTCGFTPDATADGFVAFDSLTEADVLAWVWDSVDKDATEASLTAKIEADKNPVTTTGTPW